MQPAMSQASVKTILVAVTERGHRVGETHHRAKISDDHVERIRDMHEYEGKTCKQIAALLQMSLRTVEKICKYEYRIVDPTKRWKRIEVLAAP